MKHEKMFKRDLARVQTPAIEKILPDAEAKQAKRAPRAKKRVGVLAVSVILCCVMVLGAAAATTAPLIRKILNDKRVTENTQQLTVVPEGYVGIYTKEDLLGMSNCGDEMPAVKYILMNDITFTDEDYAAGGICEGGIKPIKLTHSMNMEGRTVVAHTFLNTFNGNGYVIRNLKLIPDKEGRIGLFRSVGTVINLGIENCEINYVKYTGGRQVFAGAIAGTVNFVGACYVDGLVTNIHYDMTENEYGVGRYEIMVGGLCGQANHVDSCFVNNAKINVSGSGLDDSSDDEVVLNIGGVAGYSNICLTSWFSGEIENTLKGKFYSESVNNIIANDLSNSFPYLMDGETFELIREKVLAKYGEDHFEYKVFCAYFLKKDINVFKDNPRALEELMVLLNQLNDMTGGKMDLENQKVWYVFDPVAMPSEKGRIYGIFLNAVDGDTEALAELCEYAYLTYGETYCYTLDLSKPLSSADLEGFDFEKIWTFRDGKPVQQVFVH